MLGFDALDDLGEDDIFEPNNYSDDELEDNQYLCNHEKALELISKIIPIEERRNIEGVNRIKRIDSLIDNQLLGALKYVHLNKEAELQLELSNIGKRLYEEKKYNVIKNKAIVGLGGKFSAGKSKFINSLLNVDELLPENQNPTTSIATYIVQGKENSIFVYTNGNVEERIDRDAFSALTHSFYKKYKIGFSSFIDCIIVNNKNMSYGDIVFLDTPGYSKADVFGGINEEINLSDANKAYLQLSEVDFLIWLIDIENGEISTSDLEFIKKLKLHSPILFVLNKADKKTDDDIEKIIAKVSNTVKSSGILTYGVTAYSSRNSEEWHDNKIAEFLNIVSEQKRNNQDLRLRLKEIELSVKDEIEKNLESVHKENINLYQVINDSNNVIEIKSLVDIYGEGLEEYRRLLECRNMHERNSEELERKLKQYYGDDT